MFIIGLIQLQLHFDCSTAGLGRTSIGKISNTDADYNVVLLQIFGPVKTVQTDASRVL